MTGRPVPNMASGPGRSCGSSGSGTARRTDEANRPSPCGSRRLRLCRRQPGRRRHGGGRCLPALSVERDSCRRSHLHDAGRCRQFRMPAIFGVVGRRSDGGGHPLQKGGRRLHDNPLGSGLRGRVTARRRRVGRGAGAIEAPFADLFLDAREGAAAFLLDAALLDMACRGLSGSARGTGRAPGCPFRQCAPSADCCRSWAVFGRARASAACASWRAGGRFRQRPSRRWTKSQRSRPRTLRIGRARAARGGVPRGGLRDDGPFVPLLLKLLGSETQLSAKQVTVDGALCIGCRNEAEAEKDRADRQAVADGLRRRLADDGKALIGDRAYRRYHEGTRVKRRALTGRSRPTPASAPGRPASTTSSCCAPTPA